MLTATCRCGAVKVEVPRRPRTLTSCNCSICRRYGTLWAYYPATSVRIVAKPKALDRYDWGRKHQDFLRCATCGCIMAWVKKRPTAASRTGVNARNLEPEAIAGARVRRLDGADTWKYLD